MSRRVWGALLVVLVVLLLPGRAALGAAGPTVAVDRSEAGKGGSVTVTGAGWRPHALLTLVICGQNMIGGTNACANADGRTVTTAADGTFRRGLPVAEPPKPCPCVVHVATVLGPAAAADAAFRVAGHPIEPLPPDGAGARLSVLDARLEGADGVLTWFGAPPRRRLVLTVGNPGSAAVKDPVFRIGTSHEVLAPEWERRTWHGTVDAGRRARVSLGVELAAGAYGDYVVSLEYGGKVVVEQPWGVGRPWGVTLFWVLLGVVGVVGAYRLGMTVVDRVRPRMVRDPGEGTGELPWFRPGTVPPVRGRSARGKDGGGPDAMPACEAPAPGE